MGTNIRETVIQVSPKAKVVIICISCIIATACFGCMGITEVGSTEDTRLVGNYYLICEISACRIGRPLDYYNSSFHLYDTDPVVDVDWDSDFVVIKTQRSDDKALAWHIIDIGNGEIFGPFIYDEYLVEREKFSISDQVNLLEPQKGLFEIYNQEH